MTRIVPDGSLAWPELHQLVNCCINRIWRAGLNPEKAAAELAAAMRTYIEYQ